MLAVKAPAGVAQDAQSLKIGRNVYLVKPGAVAIEKGAKVGEILRTLNTPMKLRV